MAIQIELPEAQFNNVIRMVLGSDQERVRCIRAATFNALKRLRASRDLSKAITAAPAGSDNCDTGSLFTWLNKIGRRDKTAVQQVVAIDASAVSRTS